MKTFRNLAIIVGMLAIMIALAPGHQALAQDVACDADVVVQADDWLSKIVNNNINNFTFMANIFFFKIYYKIKYFSKGCYK